MGLFSGKKKTYVSSSVWNMAGDIKDRTNYLKAVVAGNVLLDSPRSLGEDTPRSYINGPGMGLRRYANWARGPSNYNNDVGFVGGGISFGSSVDPTVLALVIPKATNEFVVLNEYDIGLADPDWWAQSYMVGNHQELLFTNWFSQLDETTGNIVITFADTTTVSFAPVGFDSNSRYITALYHVVAGGTTGPIVEGSKVTVASESDFPPVPAGYTLYDVVETLTTKTTTYHKYSVIDYGSSIRQLYVQETTDLLVLAKYEYRFDTQTVANDYISAYRYYTYKQGSGIPVLDSMFSTPDPAGQYLPYIPIRINNTFIRDSDSVLYSKTERAFFKAMSGARLDKLVDKVSENEQLGDLDFVYAVYGVSLNSPENTAREYMYRFFGNMLSDSSGSEARFLEWETKWAEADASMSAYVAWAQNNSTGSGVPPPVVIPYPELPVVSVDVKSTTDWMNFHMAIQTNGIKSGSGTGLFAGRKKGDFWIETKPTKVYRKQYVTASSGGAYQGSEVYNVEVEHLVIYSQISDTNWESIEVYGLVHNNYVYDGKWVVITGREALNDSEESGFLIPIHEQTFRQMRLVDSTQLATACCYLVFNCYKTVKQKWYQTSFFKVLLIVGIVVVSIVFAPAGAGASGVLGSSVAVGTTIGFTGTAALVAGTVANAIAAMVITKALTVAFGDTLGPLLGAAVTIGLTVSGGIGGGGTFDAGSVVTELSKVDNIMALTDGLVKSVSGYMADKTKALMEETQRMMDKYKDEMMDVAKQYDEMFGGSRGIVDPLMYTDAGYSGFAESSGVFIERTLMCGSDIAEMTQDLINNFTRVTLNLDLPS